MIVFTMMAVGLNVVVGYAGLLDLGYVAFYAAGAYTAAWFASPQFEQVTSTSARSGQRRRCRGSTCRSGSSARSPAASRRSSEISIGLRRCACAATTSRS
jgi:ABC-type branched-subunit amino acid transport system permease subunit